MLRPRDLDDQNFDEIVEHAVSRLPQLCPQWTNHNPSDPGITLIELLAWYKELQQFHLNAYTDAMKRKLLKLAGERVRPAVSARCRVRWLTPGAACRRGARLETSEGIVFELEDDIPAQPAKIVGVYQKIGGDHEDIFPLLQQGNASVSIFAPGPEGRGELLIGLETFGAAKVPLWFELEDAGAPPRNAFADPAQCPRVIAWELEGAGAAQILSDETHALSQSGLVTLAAPPEWQETRPVPQMAKARYLRLRLTDPGCEEEVVLRAACSGCGWAVQQETWSELHCLTVPAAPDTWVLFGEDAAREGEFTVFLRRETGWEQCGAQPAAREEGAGIRLDSTGAVQDGGPNLYVACSDPIHYQDLFFDSDGLPGQTLRLDLGGRKLRTDRFVLICDTLCPDGAIRPQLWQYAEDLYSCGPRDRCFTYSPEREEILFGNGENGAVVPRGDAAIFLAGLVLTEGKGGNIPAGERLHLADGRAVANDASTGGRDEETTAEAAARLLCRMEQEHPCVTAEDYEELACGTPGLRVESARALPGRDPRDGAVQNSRPVVTVAVMPASPADKPLPDPRFLQAVRHNLETLRPVGTELWVVPPRYVGVSLTVRVQTSGPVREQELRRAAIRCLRVRRGGRRIGDPVSAADLAAAFQKLPGVMAVRRVELSSSASGCVLTVTGDLTLPADGAPFLEGLSVLSD